MVSSKQAAKGERMQPNKKGGPNDQQARTHKGKTNKHMEKT